MGSERGSAALGVIGALTLSTLVGVGVYTVIKNNRVAAAATDAHVVREPPPAPAAPAPLPPEPAPVSESIAAPQQPVDVAEASAVDPEISGSPETTAPTFGTPGIDGQLDPEAVAVAVRASSSRLQRCVEARVAAGATVNGTLRARLELNRRGGVTAATTQGIDDELATCVNGVLRDVRLPRTKDGGTARVVYPIAFHTQRPVAACDEVSCVLDNYEGACCAKYKPGAPRPTTNGVPDTVSREELRTALAALRAPVGQCAADDNFTGLVKVRFRVLPSGDVSVATIADVEPALAACVSRAFKKYTFPASVNGVNASFPFTISSE